ncbi:MAG: GNAT family N-acetyltransferase [Planctomycetota bacterium]
MHPYRRLAAPVVGVIVYGVPAANLAARNAATGWQFAGMDRSAALSLLNERMVCIRRVIIEPRYRGLGLAKRLVAETMPLTGAAMVEAVSVMGRVHPFFERAGMQAFGPSPEAKTERMAAALEAVGLGKQLWHDSEAVHAKIKQLGFPQRTFIDSEMARFCQKFTNRRKAGHCIERTGFVLSKLAAAGAYYLWQADKNEE